MAGHRTSDGQATVEMALIMPLVVLAMLAVIQVALVVRAQVLVVHAAREAARTASVDRDPTRAVAAARRVVAGATVDQGARPGIGEPHRVTVRTRYRTALPLVGILFPDPELSASAVMGIER